ncbi:MAG: cysteine synthase family protein [Bdellovibrionales bacterium]|nr:cysteine synthase family protein [Bdellovibrionales bacterium]
MHPKPYNSALDLIGQTPLIELRKVVPGSPHRFFAKVEYFNPGGSVKDRMAAAIIEQAEKRGDLKPGGTIVEATSGNTGVGLAMIAAIKGYRCVFTIPSKMSEEKVNTLRGFGAEVIVTPSGVAADDPRSHYSVAKEIARTRPHCFLANQYDNPDNPAAHIATTGPEIWAQTDGKVDVFVNGAGTGGTISGTGRYLKTQKPSVKIVCADPVGSILYDLFYHKEVRTPPAPYSMEGIGEDMLPKNVHMNVIDAFVQVEDKESFQIARRIAREEGLFVGPSSGAALIGAIKYSQTLKDPKTIVVLFPDNGSKYLSKLYNDKWMKDQGLL